MSTPRSLRGPLLRVPYDLAVKELPGLSVRRVEEYLDALKPRRDVRSGGASDEPQP
jgi:hypothetical protein